MRKVRFSSVIKIILKSLLIPLIAMFAISKFNLFSYITFIPKDYRFESGLTFYLVIIETLWSFFAQIIEKSRANVTCIFCRTEEEENINNIPTVVCDDCIGVAYLQCHVILEGNLKVLRKNALNLALPQWLSTQISANDTVLSYRDNMLNWDFCEILPENGTISQNVEYKVKIPFIRNNSNNTLSVTLRPQLKKNLTNIAINFKTNEAKIQTKE